MPLKKSLNSSLLNGKPPGTTMASIIAIRGSGIGPWFVSMLTTNCAYSAILDCRSASAASATAAAVAVAAAPGGGGFVGGLFAGGVPLGGFGGEVRGACWG